MFEFLLARSTQFADLTGEHHFCRHCNCVYHDSRSCHATSNLWRTHTFLAANFPQVR